MKTLNIRGLDDELHQRLRLQAARHERSMEAEARNILAEALPESGSAWLQSWLQDADLIEPGELPLPARDQALRSVDFE